MSQQTCSCADRSCFHGGCACFTKEGVCSKDCKCRGKCENILDNEDTIAEKFAEHTKNKAPAAQTLPSGPVVAVLAPDTRAKPFPARKPGSGPRCSCPTSQCENGNCRCVRAVVPCCDRCKCKDCRNRKKLQDLFPGSGIKGEVPASGRTTRGAAQAAKESAVGCKCQTKCASRCGCMKRNIKCSSKCKCKPRCGNDDGSRFTNKSKAGAGGQGSTRSSSSAVESTGKRPKRV